MKNIVIVGAGQAGSSLAAMLRKEEFDGSVTLIGSEPDLPYQRPPLSKAYLLGEMTRERLFLRPDSFYEEQNITLRLGQAVKAIDATAQTVSFGDEVMPYDRLIFTTGASPHHLPASIGGDLQGVFVMRQLADADAVAQEFTEGQHVLIVGGGYIGLEAAAVAAKKGFKVTLVEMAERILQRVACPQTSDYFRKLHQSHGVNIVEGVGVKRLIGKEGRVTGAELSDGRTLEVNFVIAGIGIAPSTDIAEAAGVTIENGIRTDSLGRTNVSNIWAAGDCASFPYKSGRIRLESVPNAINHAEAVGRNLLGANEDYIAKPWFWSDQFDVKLQIAGLNTGYDNVVTREAGRAVSFWYYRGSELVAVDAANDPRSYMIGKRLIEADKSADPTLVADPDADLKSLL